MYDKDCKILYYSSNSVSELKGVLGIHPATTYKCLKLESLYLNQFVINDKLITDAKKADLSLIELNNLISEKKKLLLKSFSKVTSKPICIKEINTGKVQDFISIISVVKYFKANGLKADRNKIAKCLDTNEIYLNHIYSLP